MTQKDWFKKLNTDWLLSLRYRKVCPYPRFDGDEPHYAEIEDWGMCKIGYEIDKDLLRQELSTRPHRVRAKHKRKRKL